MTVMAMTEARALLPHLLDRVEAGEEVTITRRRKPVAVLIRPDLAHPPAMPAVVLNPAGLLHPVTVDPDAERRRAGQRRAAAGNRISEAEPMEPGDLFAGSGVTRDRRG